ncbi:Uncharacterised protein [Mycobacterium tuberculosis]|nr:Uncharacterised protein [Mycobacterium tuberculosis]
MEERIITVIRHKITEERPCDVRRHLFYKTEPPDFLDC